MFFLMFLVIVSIVNSGDFDLHFDSVDFKSAFQDEFFKEQEEIKEILNKKRISREDKEKLKKLNLNLRLFDDCKWPNGTPIFFKATEKPELFKEVLTFANFDLNQADFEGKTILHIFSDGDKDSGKKQEMMRFLLRNQSSVDIEKRDNQGNTALMNLIKMHSYGVAPKDIKPRVIALIRYAQKNCKKFLNIGNMQSNNFLQLCLAAAQKNPKVRRRRRH